MQVPLSTRWRGPDGSLLMSGVCATALLFCLAVQAKDAAPGPASSAAVSSTAPAKATQRPPLWLAQVWKTGLPIADYWVSEKYDGVRGYWDGHQLLSRSGQPIAAPAWFTAGWPATPLDGELWAGRGRFAEAQSTTAQTQPDDAAWRRMRFMVFDLPGTAGSFDARLLQLQAIVTSIHQPWVQAVVQQKLSSEAQLQQLLQRTVKAGGEGLMLHKGSALYRSGRSDDLLKLKPFDDAEAQVVGYKPGRGQWQGKTGALLVRAADGRQFSLGSGLSAEQRATPPALGSWVTYRYQGVHVSGLPRFARFLRERKDLGFEPPPMPVKQSQAP